MCAQESLLAQVSKNQLAEFPRTPLRRGQQQHQRAQEPAFKELPCSTTQFEFMYANIAIQRGKAINIVYYWKKSLHIQCHGINGVNYLRINEPGNLVSNPL